jgi:hypothetical protein
MIKRPIIAILVASSALTAVLLMCPFAGAQATTTNFSQKILPLDCIFQEVNDGTGTLIYLTPEECGVILTPPPASSQTTDTYQQPTSHPVYLRITNPIQQSTAEQLLLQTPNTGTFTLPLTRDYASRPGEQQQTHGWWMQLIVIAAVMMVFWAAWLRWSARLPRR